jgi:hypothetical protein
MEQMQAQMAGMSPDMMQNAMAQMKNMSPADMKAAQVLSQPPCGGTVLGWGVAVTGCTADSSRAESGAWWWHSTCSGGVSLPLPT